MPQIRIQTGQIPRGGGDGLDMAEPGTGRGGPQSRRQVGPADLPMRAVVGERLEQGLCRLGPESTRGEGTFSGVAREPAVRGESALDTTARDRIDMRGDRARIPAGDRAG